MTLERKLSRALKSNNDFYIHMVFEEIYNTYGRLVYFTIMQYVKNNMDVEDITQEVFISFFNNLSKADIKNIKYYLVVSAKNKAINFLKRKNIDIVFDENIILEKIDDSSNNFDYNKIIKNMKEYITEYEIDIIIKHIVYDYSFKELAEMYDKPINTIISTYHRAIKKYKKGVKK